MVSNPWRTVADAPRPLTEQQELFVAEYPKDFNATQAAIRAGYSKKTARAQGSRLLTNVDIQIALRSKAEERAARLAKRHMDADEWLEEATKLSRGSMRKILHITPDGDPYIDLSMAGPDTLDVIQSAEIEDFVDRRERDDEGKPIARDVRRVKVKMYDKIGGLTLVGKHLGLLTERVELTAGAGFADALVAATARAEKARKG